MGFVNEYMSEADVEKYRIKEIDKRFFKAHHRPRWTVDRERDIYLRYMRNGREEFASRWEFYFYWKGCEILSSFDVTSVTSEGGAPGIHYTNHQIDVPPEALGSKANILIDLKNALTTHKDAGVRSRPGEFLVSFDF